MSVRDYEQLKTRTENIIRRKGYTIDVKEELIEIKDGDNVASYIEIYESTGLVREGPELVKPGPITDPKALRDAPKIPEAVTIELPVFNIKHVFTYDIYRGQGLANLLLVYGICKLKIQFYNIEYVITEDSSIQKDKFINNIYTKIGFRYIDAYYYDAKTDLVIPIDSEKQLHINQQFLQKSNKILDDIINKMSGALPAGKDRKPRDKSKQVSTSVPYELRSRTPRRDTNYLRNRNPKTSGGKKSNRKTKKCKRKRKLTKKRRPNRR
jgi:hypothetical protein